MELINKILGIEPEDDSRVSKVIDELGLNFEMKVEKLGPYDRRIEFPSDGKQVQMHYTSDNTGDTYEAIAKLGNIPILANNVAYPTILQEIAPNHRGISIHVDTQNDIKATVSRDFLLNIPDAEVKHAVMEDIARMDSLHKDLNRRTFTFGTDK